MRTCSECGIEFSKPDKDRPTCSRACGHLRVARFYQETRRARFEAKVNRTGECHVWTAGRFKNGYGQFRNQCAHRVAWIFERGPIPEGLNVCHKCDNPVCVRTDHLFLGTQNDNLQDCKQKNRQSKGEDHPPAKLTGDVVRRLRNRRVEFPGMSYKRIGEELGVASTTANMASRGKTWRHVDGG